MGFRAGQQIVPVGAQAQAVAAKQDVAQLEVIDRLVVMAILLGHIQHVTVGNAVRQPVPDV